MYFIDARLQLIYSMVNDNLAVGIAETKTGWKPDIT